jgi:hypothetical protein
VPIEDVFAGHPRMTRAQVQAPSAAAPPVGTAVEKSFEEHLAELDKEYQPPTPQEYRPSADDSRTLTPVHPHRRKSGR